MPGTSGERLHPVSEQYALSNLPLEDHDAADSGFLRCLRDARGPVGVERLQIPPTALNGELLEGHLLRILAADRWGWQGLSRPVLWREVKLELRGGKRSRPPVGTGANSTTAE
jgi:hypothetical protein